MTYLTKGQKTPWLHVLFQLLTRSCPCKNIVRISQFLALKSFSQLILIVFTPDTIDFEWCAHVWHHHWKAGSKIAKCESAWKLSFQKIPQTKYTVHKNKGINITRINWNGKICSTSTHFVQLPESDRNLLSLCNVTDTLVTWTIFDHSSEIPENEYTRVASELVVNDYSQ